MALIYISLKILPLIEWKYIELSCGYYTHIFTTHFVLLVFFIYYGRNSQNICKSVDSAMVSQWWRHGDGAINYLWWYDTEHFLIGIVPSRHRHSIIAIVTSRHRTIALSQHYFRTVTTSLHHHSIVTSSYYRFIDPNLDGGKVNSAVVSAFE